MPSNPFRRGSPVIVVVKLVMSLATACYALGYAARERDNRLHRRLMAAGFVLTLAIAVVLIVGVHGFHAGYRPAYWLVRGLGTEGRAQALLIAHRVLATVTLLTVCAQVYSGWRRLPLHRRLFPYAIGLWLLSYVTGMFIFQ